jgi:hypothetical protein
LPDGHPVPTDIDHGTENGAIQESKHGVVTLVIPDTDVIHVMRQAGDETVSLGQRWDFHQGNRTTNDQIAEQSDVQFQSRYLCVAWWLAARQQMPDFLKQIESEAHQFLAVSGDFQGCGLLGAIISE